SGGYRYANTHIATSIGEIRRVALPDGSAVTLDTDSRLVLSYSRGTRLIRLDRGEALFDVARDPARPFVGEGGAVRVRAVGTAFVVRYENGSDVEVTVSRGAVDVWRQASLPKSRTRLVAGRRIVATPQAFKPAEPLTEIQVAQALAWRDGIIDLEGRTL